MRQLSVSDRWFLTGDVVCGLVLHYGALLIQQRTADVVTFEALDCSGAPTSVTVLLGGGAALVALPVATRFESPDNRVAEERLQGKVDALLDQQNADPDDIAGAPVWNS
jgi:hypothetical protein